MAYSIVLAGAEPSDGTGAWAPLPAPYNAYPRGKIRVSIGGAGTGEDGNRTLQVGTPPAYGDPLSSNVITEWPRNGITVTAVEYTFPDDITIARAAQRTKEEIANAVAKGIVVFKHNGTPMTPAAIRAL